MRSINANVTPAASRHRVAEVTHAPRERHSAAAARAPSNVDTFDYGRSWLDDAREGKGWLDEPDQNASYTPTSPHSPHAAPTPVLTNDPQRESIQSAFLCTLREYGLAGLVPSDAAGKVAQTAGLALTAGIMGCVGVVVGGAVGAVLVGVGGVVLLAAILTALFLGAAAICMPVGTFVSGKKPGSLDGAELS